MPEQTIPQILRERDQDRHSTYRENLDFYNGIQWAPRYIGERQHRLTFNYAKVFIDKLTSYMMSSLDFAVDPADPDMSGEAKELARQAELAIYDTYEANNLAALDFETEIDTAVLGDGCYKVTWDQREKRVRVTTPDVQGLFAWWLGDDISKVWRVASRYYLSAEETKLLHGFTPADRSSRAFGSASKKAIIIEVWTDRTFELWIDDTLFSSKPNPYGFIPFIIFPNIREPKKFWGISDIPPIKESQRELNRAMSQLTTILELSGTPITVLENVEQTEDIAIQPGAVWTLPENSKAYLLDLLQGGGIRLHIDYIDLIYRTLHDLSESPRAAFGGMERDLSGVALEIELHPLLQKVRRKRTIRTTVYKKRNEMILKLLDKYQKRHFGTVRQRVIWGPVLPQDMMRLVQAEQMLVSSGIHSRRRAMDELRIQDPEAEFNRWMEERERILQMNRELSARSTRGGARERALPSQGEQGVSNNQEEEI